MKPEQKDTKIDRFIIWALYCLLLCFAPQLITFVIGAAVPFFILYLTGIEIRDYYKKKFIPRLRIAKMKREFSRRTSPFYGWKYELLVPPLYFPWNEVMQMKPMHKKIWVSKRELHFNDLVLSDEDLEKFHNWYDDKIGCNHNNFVTMHHCGVQMYADVYFKEVGMLHICLSCQKQIGYSGVGLN